MLHAWKTNGAISTILNSSLNLVNFNHNYAHKTKLIDILSFQDDQYFLYRYLVIFIPLNPVEKIFAKKCEKCNIIVSKFHFSRYFEELVHFWQNEKTIKTIKYWLYREIWLVFFSRMPYRQCRSGMQSWLCLLLCPKG